MMSRIVGRLRTAARIQRHAAAPQHQRPGRIRSAEPFAATAILIALIPSLPTVAIAQERQAARQDTTEQERPFVRGGRGDRPYLADLAGRLAIGGYAEAHLRFERADGVTEELGFEAKRFNLFFHSQISDFVRFGTELEVEEAGEELKLEYMTIDLVFNPSFAVRAGMLLLPLGRFNLSHDSPRNAFTDRPLVSEGILSVALSQPGVGAFGVLPLGGPSRLTYEAYAVNGFDDGILDAEEGVRLPNGRATFENNNRRLSAVGRVTYSPRPAIDIGLSGMHGQYNVSTLDGETIAEGRTVSVGALDWEIDRGAFEVTGEAALADIEVPPSLVGLVSTRQWGVYTDVVVPFGSGWIATMPGSWFEAKARIDYVDFDRDVAGDDAFRFSIGVNFRPTSNTAFKLDYFRGRSHDRFNNAADEAGILFSAATYF